MCKIFYLNRLFTAGNRTLRVSYNNVLSDVNAAITTLKIQFHHIKVNPSSNQIMIANTYIKLILNILHNWFMCIELDRDLISRVVSLNIKLFEIHDSA